MDIKNGNFILFDWLTFTDFVHTNLDEVIEFLGFDSVKTEFIKLDYGRWGYSTVYMYGNICIMLDGSTPSMGICVSLSGQGCRTFDTYSIYNFDYLLDKILNSPLLFDGRYSYNVTRLDVACDLINTNILDIGLLYDDSYNQNYVSKWRAYKCTVSDKGINIQLGSDSSDTYIRIYDKASERGFDVTDNINWVRVELVLKNSRAYNFIRYYLNNYKNNIGLLFTSTINNYLCFKVRDERDTNKSRWEICEYWLNFVKHTNKISLYTKKDIIYNLDKLQKYVLNMAGSSIYTYRELVGEDVFNMMIDLQGARISQKQKDLISNQLFNDYKICNQKYVTISDDVLV